MTKTQWTELLQDYICFYCVYGQWRAQKSKIQFRCREKVAQQPIEYGERDCPHFIADQRDYQQPF